MPYLNVGEVRIHHHTYGEGEPLVLIPGLCGDLYNWKKMVPLIKDHCHVVLMDCRGSGLTEAPDRQFTMSELADDVSGLMNGLGFSRYHVLGWSMGGNVAQEVALRHADEVASLILMSTYTRRPDRSSYAIDAMLNSVKEGASINNFMQMMNTWCLTQSYYSGKKLIPQPRNKEDEGKTLQGFMRQKAALDAFDSARRLHKIKCPTLVIHGEEDIMVPPYMGEAIARGISDSEMVYIPGAGHIIPPESCYAHIISFLERHSIKLPQAVDVKMASMAK